MRAPAVASLLLIAPLVSGCLGFGDGALDSSSLPPSALPGPQPFSYFLHDLSEPIDGVDVFSSMLVHELVDVADGIALDAWLVVPDIGEPVPLVLEVTPYYGGGTPVLPNGIHLFGTPADVLVPRGYAYGIVSVRGTGNSGGCFTIGGASEAQDTAAMVEHFAAQEWSNGNVGIMGVSYPGTTPQDVWVEAPPALKTIVPIAGISDLYKYNFVNGVPIFIQGYGFNAYYWAMVGLAPAGLGGGVQALDPPSIPGAIAGEVCTDQIDVQEGGVSSTLDGNKDAYWQERDFLAELLASPDKERASVFYIHGLEDWNVKPHNMEDWLPAVQATGVPFKAWLGQWDHAWPENAPDTCKEKADPCRADWWESAMLAWFDQFLKGRETGILDAPAVQVQDDSGTWRHESEWPPADARFLALHPSSDGSLGEAPGSGDVSYDDEMGSPRRAIFYEDPVSRVEFESEPVGEDLHLSGLVRFIGNVTSSGPVASLVLTLIERGDEGDRSIDFAAQSLNHARDLAARDDDISGETIVVDVDFFPQDDVVKKGSRLVLVAAGNFVGQDPGPDLLPRSQGSTITLHLDGAKLLLPIDETIVVEEKQPYAGELDGAR